MPPIVAPKPRSARASRAMTAPPPAIHPRELFIVPPRASTSLAVVPTPRLLSPIQLSSSAPSTESSPITVSKRRAKRYPPRRPLSPVGSPADPMIHPFDQLPWISALNAEPDHLRSWDIADLSTIPDLYPSPRCIIPPSGPGPVRRRKTSLRTSPLAPSSHAIFSSRCATPPPRDTLSRTRLSDTRPHTPLSRFNPSHVLFRHLMPVFSDSHHHNDEQEHCTFMPALQLR